MTLLEVSDLCKSYRSGGGPVRVVDDVSFTLDRGSTLAIVGESGAGKSTIARMVLRLIEPDSGGVSFDGVDVLALSPAAMRTQRRNMQMIFQDPYSSLDPRYTVGRSIGEPLKIHLGMNQADRERRTVELLERVGLGSHYVNRLPRQLSGGQLQRVSIARALSLEPKLMVCDEPIAALDVSIRAQVLNLLLDIQAETGMSYLFIAHDLGVVEVFAHEVVVLKGGKLIESGATEKVFRQPEAEYTRTLVDSIPTLTRKQHVGHVVASQSPAE